MSVIKLDTQINAIPEICYKLSLNVDLHKLSASKTHEYIVDGIMSWAVCEEQLIAIT